MNNFKKFKGLFLCFLFSFLIPFFCFWCIHNFLSLSLKNNLFCQGYKINGVDIGGLNQIQAEEKLNEVLINNNEEINLEIIYNNKSWHFGKQDFETKSNVHMVLENAYQSSHKKNISSTLNRAKKMGFNDKIVLNYVLIGIDEKLSTIISHIEKPPIDSIVKYNTQSDQFEFSQCIYGIEVDKEKLYHDITVGLQKEKNVKVFIKTNQITPQINEKKLMQATKKQSSFSTNYSKSNYDRKNNIRLATKTLNGFMIKPNETFSFNQTLGKRSVEKGYKHANIIKDGEFVKGVGGGVCQVSTTLYNALLLANIDVSEVHKHSLPISYVKPGLDAMVSWSTADLKWTNTTELPVFILGKCDGNTLTFEICGDTKPDNMEIKTVSEVVKKIPHNGDKIVLDKNGEYSDKIMFRGEYYRLKYPKDGYEAKAFVEYYLDGNFSHRKQIRHSVYEPQQGLVFEGYDKLPEGMSLPNDSFTNYPN